MIYNLKIISDEPLKSNYGTISVAIQTGHRLFELLTSNEGLLTGRSDALHPAAELYQYPDINIANNILSLLSTAVKNDMSKRIIYTTLTVDRAKIFGQNFHYGIKPYYGISFVVEHQGQLVEYDELMNIDDVKLISFIIRHQYPEQPEFRT